MIYPINIHHIRCIWGWLRRVPSQGYHHVPYEWRILVGESWWDQNVLVMPPNFFLNPSFRLTHFGLYPANPQQNTWFRQVKQAINHNPHRCGPHWNTAVRWHLSKSKRPWKVRWQRMIKNSMRCGVVKGFWNMPFHRQQCCDLLQICNLFGIQTTIIMKWSLCVGRHHRWEKIHKTSLILDSLNETRTEP